MSPADIARPDSEAPRLTTMSRVVWPLIVACTLIAAGYAFPATQMDWLLPAVLGIACFAAVFAMIPIPGLLLSPLPWFLLTYGLYFGIGPAIYPVLSVDAKAYLDAFFQFSDYWARKTNVLNIVGLIVVLVSFSLVSGDRGAGGSSPVRSPALAERLEKRVLVLCLLVGYGLKALNPPGAPDSAAYVSGVLGSLENLAWAALALLAYFVARGEWKLMWIFVPVLALEAKLAVESLSKLEILTVGMFVFAGVLWARPSRSLLAIAVGGAVFVLAAIQPLVSLGRLAQRGTGATVSAGDLVAVVRRSPDLLNELESRASSSGLTRISYGPSQAFAMDRYDRGLTGDTFRGILFVYIPRVVWPGKPIMTPGAAFNDLALGNPQSQSAPGAMAEAYWNGGWPYVVLAAVFIGALFGGFSRYLLPAISAGDARWVPAASVMMITARGPDMWFVANFVGSLSYTVLMLVVAFALIPYPRQHA